MGEGTKRRCPVCGERVRKHQRVIHASHIDPLTRRLLVRVVPAPFDRIPIAERDNAAREGWPATDG